MAVLSSKLIVSLLDRASGPARRIAASIGHMKKSGMGVASVGANMQRTARRMQRSAATATTGLSAPSALMGGMMLRNAYTFDKSLRMIAATGEMTEQQVAALRDRIVSLAKVYPKTRQEIAKGALEYITAGNTPEATNAALEDLVRGAIASNQNVGKTGADVTDVVAGYYGKISDPETYAKRVRGVLDLLSVGASSANHTWGEQTLAMQYATPVARALGMPLERLVAMVGTLADNGFKGEKGGSALRTMLIRLRKPTAEARAALKELGIDVGKIFKFNSAKALDTTLLQGHLEANFGKLGQGVITALESAMSKQRVGNVNDFREHLVAKLAKAMNISARDAGMTSLMSAIDAHLNTAVDNINLDALFNKLTKANLAQQAAIFGVRRSPQAVALSKGWEIYTDKLKKINDLAIGATERRMKIFMQGFSGSVDKLVSKLDFLSNSIEKSGLLSAFTDGIESVGEWVEKLGKSSPELLKFGGAAILALGVLGPMGMLLLGAGAAITTVGLAAKMALIPVMSMSRVSLSGLAVASLVAGWQGLSGAIGAARVQHKLMTMEMAAGNMTRAGGIMAMLAPWSRFKGILSGVLGGLRMLARFTLVGTAIVGAGTFLYNNWKGLGQFFVGLGEGFMESLGPARPVVEGIANAVGNLVDKIGAVFGPLDESGEKWRSWGKAVGSAIAAPVNAVGSMVAYVGDLANSIGNLFGLEAPSWLKWLFSSDDAAKKKAPTVSDLSKMAGSKSAVGQVGTKTASTGNRQSKGLSGVTQEAESAVMATRQAKQQIEQIASSIDLTTSGGKIMSSLAAGMRAKMHEPIDAMRHATQRIKNHVPHSPAKEGPLRGIHRHGMMQEIARGMQPSPLVSAMRRATAAAAAVGSPAMALGVGSVSGRQAGGLAGRAGANVNVNLTVNAKTNASADEIARLAGARVKQAVTDGLSDGGFT